MKAIAALIFVLGIALILLLFTPIGHRVKVKLFGGQTIEQRIEQFGTEVREGWVSKIGDYPPKIVTLFAVKGEGLLHVFADGELVLTMPITAASGTAGPKLREGDRQVPEGVYGIESLNPNSRFHLALRVDYPNAADIEQAELDGRTNLGGDIMIHGGAASVGCIAVGDDAIEDLFVLVHDVGLENVTVLIAPTDVREGLPTDKRAWVEQRYRAVRDALPE